MFDYLCSHPVDSYMPKQGPISYLRILQLSSGCKTADVYLNRNLSVKKLGFKRFTPYFSIPPNEYRIDVFQSGKTSNPIASIESTLNEGFIYSAVIEGLSGNRVLLVHDTKTKPLEDMANIRLIHISPETSSIDLVLTDGTPIFRGISYRDIPDYKAISPGKHTFLVREDNKPKPILSVPGLDFNPGWTYTLYIAGTQDGKHQIHPLLLIDGGTYID